MSTLAVANISGLAVGAPVNFLVPPLVPTATVGDSSNKVANTNFVMSAITAVSSGFAFTLGSSTVSANDTVNSISSVSLDNCPIGALVPAAATFTTSYAVAATGNVVASRTAVYASNGTVSAPAFAFGDEVSGGNTGFYKPSSGTISVSCAGAETFRFVPGAPPQVIATLPSNDNSNAVATTSFVRSLISGSNAVVGAKRGLRVMSQGTFQLYASAQELILESDAGTYVTIKNFSSVLSTGTVGLNGIDLAGTLLGNTWYQLWVVYNPTANQYGLLGVKTLTSTGTFTYGSTAVAGISDTSKMHVGTPLMALAWDTSPGTFITAVGPSGVTLNQPCVNPASSGSVRAFAYAAEPSLPSGFTHKVRIGSFYVTGDASRVMAFRQFGDQVYVNIIPGSSTTAYPNVASGTYGSVLTPTYANTPMINVTLPMTARTLLAQVYFSGTGHLMVGAGANYGGYNAVTRTPVVLGYGSAVDVSVTQPMDLENGSLYLASDQANAGVNVAGWYENL